LNIWSIVLADGDPAEIGDALNVMRGHRSDGDPSYGEGSGCKAKEARLGLK
jgi:hypothetical protein